MVFVGESDCEEAVQCLQHRSSSQPNGRDHEADSSESAARRVLARLKPSKPRSLRD